MPLQDPKIQAALAELQRRGVVPMDEPPTMIDRPQVTAANITPVAPAAAPAAAPAQDLSSPRDVERQLRLKQMKGQLAVQDAVNELQRRGVNLQLKTQPAAEEVATTQAQSAVENARQQGDPDAFKGAWRQLFPGRPLPRSPEGQVDYLGGQDDIDVEMDRRKSLETAKAGVHNITESKVTETNPATGKDQEFLVRTDKATGKVIGRTLLGESSKALTTDQSNAGMFSSRMGSNNSTILAIESKGFDPSAVSTSVQSFIPNRFRSEDMQAYEAAKRNWIAAVLRKESGAAISPQEYRDANKQYFAQDGDAKSVVQQKQSLRQQVEQQMKSAAGPHATVAPTPSATPAPAAAAPAAVSVTVDVTTAAEAPPTAKFIRSPSGRTYRNPKYTGQ